MSLDPRLAGKFTQRILGLIGVQPALLEKFVKLDERIFFTCLTIRELIDKERYRS